MDTSNIAPYLASKREEALVNFKNLKEVDPKFKNLVDELESFNFVEYSLELEEEILANVEDWWTNPKKGINPEEKLQAILIEIEDNIYYNEVSALSYGIVDWEDFEVSTESISMGYSYDFAKGFYGMPGITLEYCNPLAELESNYADRSLIKMKGYKELRKVFTSYGLESIHKAFTKLEEEGELFQLNGISNFMILIGGHDSGEAFPILVRGI